MKRIRLALLIPLAAACAREAVPARMDASVVAAGDIASCWWRWDDATARLLDHIDGTVLVMGDAVYQSGTRGQFSRCYGGSWGRHLDRTRAVPGNHDVRTEKGAPFYAYFGRATGRPGEGWFSWDQDEWHFVGLNSETDVSAGSPQLRWLERDLAAVGTRCTLVFSHRPVFSSGKHGGAGRMKDVLDVLYRHGVDVILSGHDHDYERFAPQDTAGHLDETRGMVQFVVGTGGAPLYRGSTRGPNSLAFNSRVHGVLALRLRPDSYDWEFVPTRRNVFEDRGSGRCR